MLAKYLLSGERNTIVSHVDHTLRGILFRGTTGDILHASAFGNHVVVLNNRKLAEDLFEKRAQLYSDRPDIPIVELFVDLIFTLVQCVVTVSTSIGWEYNVGLLRYGEIWRQHRKLCWQNFHTAAAK